MCLCICIWCLSVSLLSVYSDKQLLFICDTITYTYFIWLALSNKFVKTWIVFHEAPGSPTIHLLTHHLPCWLLYICPKQLGIVDASKYKPHNNFNYAVKYNIPIIVLISSDTDLCDSVAISRGLLSFGSRGALNPSGSHIIWNLCKYLDCHIQEKFEMDKMTGKTIHPSSPTPGRHILSIQMD